MLNTVFNSIARRARILLALMAFCMCSLCHAQDSLARKSGLGTDFGAWMGVSGNEYEEGPVDFLNVGVAYHSAHYTAAVGYALGDSHEDKIRGFYTYGRVKLDANLFEAEYANLNGSSATSDVVVVGTTPGNVFSTRYIKTQKLQAGYWRQVRTSPFYFGAQALYFSGTRDYDKGGSGSSSTIDEFVNSRSFNGGVGASCFYYGRAGMVIAGSLVIGAGSSKWKNDYKETETQNGNVIKEKYETVKTPVGFFVSARICIGFTWLEI